MVSKPSKAHGMAYIDHNYHAMEWVLENFGLDIAHLKSLCYTDFEDLKRMN